MIPILQDQEQENYVHKKFGRARVGSGEDDETTINTNSNKAEHDLQPQRNRAGFRTQDRLPSPTCGTILRPQAIRAQPAIMESPLVFLVPAVCMSTGCRLPGPLPYTPYTHYTTPYARQPPAPVFPPNGGLHPTHSFVPPKINSPPPPLPAAPQPLSLPPDVSFMRVNNTVASTADSTSSPVTTTTTNSVNDNGNRVKRPRKPKDDDLVPTFVKNELTRTDIVDSNIEDFNNKCADKPEEHRTILKDKRRKGKNRASILFICFILLIAIRKLFPVSGFFDLKKGALFFTASGVIFDA